MEIKRFSSICFLKREMRKDLFNIDLNNSGDENTLSFSQLRIYVKYSSECKKIDKNKWKRNN